MLSHLSREGLAVEQVLGAPAVLAAKVKPDLLQPVAVAQRPARDVHQVWLIWAQGHVSACVIHRSTDLKKKKILDQTFLFLTFHDKTILSDSIFTVSTLGEQRWSHFQLARLKEITCAVGHCAFSRKNRHDYNEHISYFWWTEVFPGKPGWQVQLLRWELCRKCIVAERWEPINGKQHLEFFAFTWW